MGLEKYFIFDIETGVFAKNADSRAGLSPFQSQISCIGCKVAGVKNEVKCFSGDIEKKVLEDFVAFFSQSPCTRLVSYNGWAFDLTFLRVRAVACGVKLPAVFWQDGVNVDPFYELARAKSGKLSDFASLLGTKCEGTGLECLDWFNKREFSKIESHCAADVLVLDKLFCRMVDAGFPLE